MNPVISFLQTEVSFLRHHLGNPPDINGYCSMSDFVLRNGRVFEPSLTSPCWAMGKQNCFQCSAEAALLERSLTYCEGYAISMIPVLHAWLIDGDGRLIETTWPTIGEAYFGIPFRTDYLRQTIHKLKHYSMIDQWEHDWPTIRTDKKLWLRKL